MNRLVVLLLLALLATPVTPAAAETVIAADHADIRYQGRWGQLGDAMATVNSGSGAVLPFTATDYTDGLHPTYAGHLRVARRLAPIIADRLGWTVSTMPNPKVALLAAGAAPGFESATAPGWRPGAHVSTVSVSATTPYDGRTALQATSTAAPLGEWRTVSLRTRLCVPAGARDLFVYVSPDLTGGTLYDARLTVAQGGRTRTTEANGLPHLAGFIPWNRLHVNLSGNAPVTAISVSVRVEGTTDSGQLSFQVDDVGWTGVSGG